ncbi:hypothetical protein D3C87_1867910 [compost metagenome]
MRMRSSVVVVPLSTVPKTIREPLAVPLQFSDVSKVMPGEEELLDQFVPSKPYPNKLTSPLPEVTAVGEAFVFNALYPLKIGPSVVEKVRAAIRPP